MQRFYYNQDFSPALYLTDLGLIEQIIKVLRARVGEEFIFFDEKYDVVYQLEKIEKRKLVFKKIRVIEKKSDIARGISLYIAIPNKLEKIERIVQKCTEIGVKNFFFFRSERSQKLYISEKKYQRFKKIILEAIEQSGQNIIPELYFLENLDYSKLGDGHNVFFHTRNVSSKKISDIKSVKINIFIGPEGGFSPEEIELFLQKKFSPVWLGENILRVETCAVVTSFFLLQE